MMKRVIVAVLTCMGVHVEGWQGCACVTYDRPGSAHLSVVQPVFAMHRVLLQCLIGRMGYMHSTDTIYFHTIPLDRAGNQSVSAACACRHGHDARLVAARRLMHVVSCSYACV
jgi:hypothetical protein